MKYYINILLYLIFIILNLIYILYNNININSREDDKRRIASLDGPGRKYNMHRNNNTG